MCKKKNQGSFVLFAFFFAVTQSFFVGSARNETNVLKPRKVSFFSLYFSYGLCYGFSSRSSLQSVYLILYL